SSALASLCPPLSRNARGVERRGRDQIIFCSPLSAFPQSGLMAMRHALERELLAAQGRRSAQRLAREQSRATSPRHQTRAHHAAARALDGIAYAGEFPIG